MCRARLLLALALAVSVSTAAAYAGWQTPGEIQVPKGTWQVPGDIQVPKGIEAVREQDAGKCLRHPLP